MSGKHKQEDFFITLVAFFTLIVFGAIGIMAVLENKEKIDRWVPVDCTQCHVKKGETK